MDAAKIDAIHKLIGRVDPVGSADMDDERFKNLQDMCTVVENLIAQIENIAKIRRVNFFGTEDRAAKYADNFLTQILDR